MSAITGKSTDEIRGTTKDPINNKGERLTEDGSGALANGTNGTKGGIPLERSASKGGANNFKREEASASEEALSSKTKSVAPPRVGPPATLNTDLNPTSIRLEREREQRPSRARSSKTSTPMVNTFAESEAATRDNHRTDTKIRRPPSSSSRSARNKDPLHDSLSPSGLPPKRSHKKGAGLAAQAAVLQAKLAKQNINKAGGSASNTSNENTVENNAIPNNSNNNSNHYSTSSPSPTTNLSDPGRAVGSGSGSGAVNDASEPEDVEEEENLDSSNEEPRYCYCQQVSYGEMVACDAEDCPREWFHLECVGLGRAPGRNARWFCEECKERLRVGAASGSGVIGMGVGVGAGQAQLVGGGGGGRRGR